MRQTSQSMNNNIFNSLKESFDKVDFNLIQKLEQENKLKNQAINQKLRQLRAYQKEEKLKIKQQKEQQKLFKQQQKEQEKQKKIELKEQYKLMNKQQQKQFREQQKLIRQQQKEQKLQIKQQKELERQQKQQEREQKLKQQQIEKLKQNKNKTLQLIRVNDFIDQEAKKLETIFINNQQQIIKRLGVVYSTIVHFIHKNTNKNNQIQHTIKYTNLDQNINNIKQLFQKIIQSNLFQEIKTNTKDLENQVENIMTFEYDKIKDCVQNEKNIKRETITKVSNALALSQNIQNHINQQTEQVSNNQLRKTLEKQRVSIYELPVKN